MSIDDITLSGELRKKLYKNNITNLNRAIPKRPPEIPFSGKNRNNILIAYDAKLKKDEREVLENLMKACQTTLDDVALINMQEQEASLSEILSVLNIKKAILFGLPSLSIAVPGNDREEHLIEYGNISLIRTAPLAALIKNIEKKKALWLALKAMFNL